MTTSTISVPVISEHRSIVELQEERARLQARHDELEQEYRAAKSSDASRMDVPPAELEAKYPLAHASLERRRKNTPKEWGVDTVPKTLSRLWAISREMDEVHAAIGDTERAIRAARQELLSKAQRDIHRQPSFREAAMALAAEVSDRHKAALAYLEATQAGRRQGIQLIGVPASVAREIDELLAWLAQLRRLGVLEASQLQELHPYVRARLEARPG